jgi:hypothetical protein
MRELVNGCMDRKLECLRHRSKVMTRLGSGLAGAKASQGMDKVVHART